VAARLLRGGAVVIVISPAGMATGRRISFRRSGVRIRAYKWVGMLVCGGVTLSLGGCLFGGGGLQGFFVDTLLQIAAKAFFDAIKAGGTTG
jgi:hypothetical protein